MLYRSGPDSPCLIGIRPSAGTGRPVWTAGGRSASNHGNAGETAISSVDGRYWQSDRTDYTAM